MALELFEYLFSDLKEAVWEKGPAFQSWFSGPRIVHFGGPTSEIIVFTWFSGFGQSENLSNKFGFV